MDAPSGPGVYFLVDGNREFRYVGKAGNLCRRLAEHRRSGRLDGMHVGWEACETEREALLRETDLIVFLRPAGNRSHTEQPPTSSCVFHRAVASTARSRTSPRAGPGEAGEGRLRRPVRLVDVVDVDQRALHDFLTGSSRRFLETPLDHLDPVARLAAERDVAAAGVFFSVGPQRLRGLRVRHRLPAGPVAGDDVTRCLSVEVRAVIGEFTVAPASGAALLVGRRTARSMELRSRPR